MSDIGLNKSDVKVGDWITLVNPSKSHEYVPLDCGTFQITRKNKGLHF